MDGNGTLDVEEAQHFLEDFMRRHCKDGEEAEAIVFEDLDINGDGEIDKGELKQFLYDQRMLNSEAF